METLITCKEGCEKILANEVAACQGTFQAKGRGWILAQWKSALPFDLCFAYHVLKDPFKVCAASVNGLTGKLFDLFAGHIRGKRFAEPWPFAFFSSSEERLVHRVQTVERNWSDKLRKKIARVARLSRRDLPRGPGWTEGFFVYLIGPTEAFVSFRAIGAEQQRMRLDSRAPSRSYLKIEEAFHVLGCGPRENETVVDLGAAPGGWSHSARKRGARVIAVDNGPMKGAVASGPGVVHLKVDAFKYVYDRPRPADWLFCDILENPDVVLGLLGTWLGRRWCRRFIVNLKVGRADPVALLKKIRDPQEGIAPHCASLHVKQLYHDREEITLMGEGKGR